MTFTSLEKYVHSKKCLKQRRQLNPTPHPPPPPSPPPLRLVKSKVFSRRKGHLATAVIGGRLAPMASNHGGRCGTDFVSYGHNYFISQQKQLCQVNQNNRTLLGPYYGYQLTKYSYKYCPRIRNSLLAYCSLGYYLSCSIFNVF